MYCSKCGCKLADDSLFCSQCGRKIEQNMDVDNDCNPLGSVEIIKAKVTFVFHGYGYLTLTDKAIIWNKSASSYIAFGALNALTDNHVVFMLSDLSKIKTYTYFPGGGLVIVTKNGKEQKVAFKHKKDFVLVFDYLTKYLSNRL